MSALTAFPCGTVLHPAIVRERRAHAHAHHLLTCPHTGCRREGAALLRGWAMFREGGGRIELTTALAEHVAVTRDA